MRITNSNVESKIMDAPHFKKLDMVLATIDANKITSLEDLMSYPEIHTSLYLAAEECCHVQCCNRISAIKVLTNRFGYDWEHVSDQVFLKVVFYLKNIFERYYIGGTIYVLRYINTIANSVIDSLLENVSVATIDVTTGEKKYTPKGATIGGSINAPTSDGREMSETLEDVLGSVEETVISNCEVEDFRHNLPLIFSSAMFNKHPEQALAFLHYYLCELYKDLPNNKPYINLTNLLKAEKSYIAAWKKMIKDLRKLNIPELDTKLLYDCINKEKLSTYEKKYPVESFKPENADHLRNRSKKLVLSCL